MSVHEEMSPAHFHDPGDTAYAASLKAHVPSALAAWAAFDEAALRAPDRVLPRKYTELMAVAVALTTQCPYCIKGHVNAARAEGASEQELAETAMVSAALRGGAGLAHSLMAFKFYSDGATDDPR